MFRLFLSHHQGACYVVQCKRTVAYFQDVIYISVLHSLKLKTMVNSHRKHAAFYNGYFPEYKITTWQTSKTLYFTSGLTNYCISLCET
jgi:hypothetical protein